MNNFSEQPDRRIVTDSAGLNRFLTRMYGNMVVAILVSAFSAYLTMNTFRREVFGYFGAHPAMIWLILLLPIALSMGISFSATRNPVGAFVMLMLISIIYGVEFALIAGVYTGASIASAFVSSSVIFIVMAIYGTVTKRELTKFGSHAMDALISLIISYIINSLLNCSAIAYIFLSYEVLICDVFNGWASQHIKMFAVNLVQ